MTNDRSDAQASGSSDYEGHLIPPIWMEENKEAFDAMKAQVEREEARRSDMGVDVAMHEARFFLQVAQETDTMMRVRDWVPVIEALLRALDAKEREVAEMTLHAELFASDVAQLQAKLDAVKSAHPMVSDAGQREHCGACIKPWPCLTIQALDAD